MNKYSICAILRARSTLCSDPTCRAATTNPDDDLPGNDLDPNNTTPDQRKAIPLIVRAYGALCALDGVVALPLTAAYFGIMVYRLCSARNPSDRFQPHPYRHHDGDRLRPGVRRLERRSSSSAGRSWKSYRRDAGRWAYALIVMTVAQILIDVMLQGIGVHLIRPMIQLGILTALSATIDPTLRQERELQRRLRDLEDREAAAEGMLGQDLTGEGYIKLNFFNLFWVFMVLLRARPDHRGHLPAWCGSTRACTRIEPAFCSARSAPSTARRRVAYRCAQPVLKRSFVLIFLVSALIGGVFEELLWAGGCRPRSARSHGRTPTTRRPASPIRSRSCSPGVRPRPFMLMWGTLGLFWIKVCLPRLLKRPST